MDREATIALARLMRCVCGILTTVQFAIDAAMCVSYTRALQRRPTPPCIEHGFRVMSPRRCRRRAVDMCCGEMKAMEVQSILMKKVKICRRSDPALDRPGDEDHGDNSH